MKETSLTPAPLALAAFAILAVSPAQAATTFYDQSTRSTYASVIANNAGGSNEQHFDTYPPGVYTPLPILNLANGTATSTGGVVVAGAGVGGAAWTTGGALLFGPDGSTISFDFTRPLRAFGFDFLVSNPTLSGTLEYAIPELGLAGAVPTTSSNSFFGVIVDPAVDFPSATFAHISFTARGGYGLIDNLLYEYPPTGGGVPEPSAWVLMLLGFGGVSATLRRRRRAAPAL